MIAGLVALVVYLLIIGLIVWLLLYLIDNIPLPEPFHKVARVVVIAVGVLILVYLLLGALGEAPRIKLP